MSAGSISPLLTHRGGAEHVLRPQPHTDVAAVAIHIFPFPQLAAHTDDLRPQSLSLEGVAATEGEISPTFGSRKNLHYSLHHFPYLLHDGDCCLLRHEGPHFTEHCGTGTEDLRTRIQNSSRRPRVEGVSPTYKTDCRHKPVTWVTLA